MHFMHTFRFSNNYVQLVSSHHLLHRWRDALICQGVLTMRFMR